MKSKNKFLQSVVMLLTIALDFYIIRPVKAIGAGLSSFSHAMGMPGGLLINTWTSNQNVDAPGTSANASVAAAGTVACNAEIGRITLTGFNAAAGAMQIATITNNKIVSTGGVLSQVSLQLDTYAGTWATDGEPVIYAATTTAGQFVIRVKNNHGANALNGNITVVYRVHQVVQ